MAETLINSNKIIAVGDTSSGTLLNPNQVRAVGDISTKTLINPNQVATPVQLYAYSDGNNNTIYAKDEDLQGTFKSLNTNDFTNNGAIIDSNGIADLSTPPSYIRMNNMFLPSSNSWEVFFDATIDSVIDWQTFISRSVNQIKLFNLNRNGTGNNLECNFAITSNAWETITSYGALSSALQAKFGFNGSNTYFFNTKTDGGVWNEQTRSSPYPIQQPTDQDPVYINLGSEETGSVGSAGCHINLTTTYFKIGVNKITPAIFNTTSQLYNGGFEKITATAEHYDNVIKIGNTIYTRNSEKDTAAVVPD